MSKKVLFVNSSLTAGGSERVMAILANEFANLNYNVSMVLVRNSNKENYSVNKNVEVIRLKYKFKNSFMKIVERVFKLRKLMKKNKYDVIISFTHKINTLVLFSAMGLKNSIIVSERCDPKQFSKLNRQIDNFFYRKAKYIVLQTELVRRDYPNFLQTKMVVIPNPVIENHSQSFQGKIKNKIVSAGRLVEQKNFSMLIEAFSKIVNKHDYQLYIYGEGVLRKQLEEKIKDLHLEDKVFLPGYVSNVDDLIKDAKIYVCSSNYEGISNSMLEAMVMGIPTISTDCPVGGSAMMIKDHENGILIPVNDCESLVKAMLEIIEDNDLAHKLSSNSKKIIERLDSKKIVKEWEKLI